MMFPVSLMDWGRSFQGFIVRHLKLVEVFCILGLEVVIDLSGLTTILSDMFLGTFRYITLHIWTWWNGLLSFLVHPASRKLSLIYLSFLFYQGQSRIWLYYLIQLAICLCISCMCLRRMVVRYINLLTISAVASSFLLLSGNFLQQCLIAPSFDLICGRIECSPVSIWSFQVIFDCMVPPRRKQLDPAVIVFALSTRFYYQGGWYTFQFWTLLFQHYFCQGSLRDIYCQLVFS